jgi:hypothetical protein
VSRRPWTPDRIVIDRGERMLEQSPKRGCNRCHTVLGDLTDAEMVTEILGRRLPPVHGECPLCLGFHAILVEPAAPVEPGSDVIVTGPANLHCPGALAGVPVASCASWDLCGCVPGPEIEVPSEEWVAFLAAPCPTSPTGEHRHLADRDVDGTPYVGAPVAKTCRYIDTVRRVSRQSDESGHLDRLVADFVTGPGLYPVEIEEFDPDLLVFEPLDIAPHRPAEVTPL